MSTPIATSTIPTTHSGDELRVSAHTTALHPAPFNRALGGGPSGWRASSPRHVHRQMAEEISNPLGSTTPIRLNTSGVIAIRSPITTRLPAPNNAASATASARNTESTRTLIHLMA
jgi:hypothetical protein